MSISGKSYYYLSVFCYFFVILLGLVAFYKAGDIPPWDRLAALFSAGVLSIGTTLFRPAMRVFERWLNKQAELGESSYRVLVYGQPGAGKTTFIKNALSYESHSRETTTDQFEVYTAALGVDFGRAPADEELPGAAGELVVKHIARTLRISIADYCGQEPDQVLLTPPDSFFGEPGDRTLDG